MEINLTSIPSHNTEPKTVKNAQLLEKAVELESVFLHEMLKSVFENINEDEDSLFGSHAQETYQGLLTKEYADAIAKAGGIGLADHIHTELLAIQESVQNKELSTHDK